jgi:hypothetical protein
MRKQFVIDKKTNKLLEELASYHGGNRSLVVRHAMQVYSDMEDRLEEIGTNPAVSSHDGQVRCGQQSGPRNSPRGSRAPFPRKDCQE